MRPDATTPGGAAGNDGQVVLKEWPLQHFEKIISDRV
jgi:hypothetical protein